MLSDATLLRYADLVDDIGIDAAAEKVGIKKETMRRNIRFWRNKSGESKPAFDDKLIQQLQSRFTAEELRRLLSSSHFENLGTTVEHSFDGDRVCFGFLTDLHLGSIYTHFDILESALEMCRARGVEFIAIAGDIFEGLSHRPGHAYECSHLGYSAQLQHGREVLGSWNESPIYIIDGNHDRWYIKSNGAVICEELARSCDNITFLGHDEGDIKLGHITIKLWHGEDGSSYAFSYRVQKIVESFTGGEKPNILLCGHTHKAFYTYDRHIHCLSGGAIQTQSKWMRSKRQQNHTGFWIVEMTVNDNGVASFSPEFFPFYR